MVRAVTLRQALDRAEAAEARVRRLEAEAEMQGKIMFALIAETDATDEQVKNAALRACGIEP